MVGDASIQSIAHDHLCFLGLGALLSLPACVSLLAADAEPDTGHLSLLIICFFVSCLSLHPISLLFFLFSSSFFFFSLS